MTISKLDTFLNVKNKEDKEPALKIGVSTAGVAGVLALVSYLFPHLLNERQTALIFVISAFALPIITAIFTRGKVWSVASVEEVIEEAVQDALASRGTK